MMDRIKWKEQKFVSSEAAAFFSFAEMVKNICSI